MPILLLDRLDHSRDAVQALLDEGRYYGMPLMIQESIGGENLGHVLQCTEFERFYHFYRFTESSCTISVR
jgi:hypothetical protein